MDVKLLIDSLVQHAQPLAMLLLVLISTALLLRTKFVKRLKSVIEEMIFSNWQLALLGTTGIVLSAAAGWRTWEGMYNFTGEPLLSGMVTFGIQGILLIVAWLIGESFATGMNTRPDRGQSNLVTPAAQTWLGLIIGTLLFAAGFILFLQWNGETDIRSASIDDLSWSKTGDKFLMFGAGLLIVALFVLYAASDIVRPYIQGVRIVIRNSMLWLMLFATMGTSVFFSFDSFFTAIFPQSERVRAAELRAQNQVAGIVADIEQAIASRKTQETDALFQTEAWSGYEGQLDSIAKAAAASQGAIERYVNDQIEQRRTAVREQQERMASAQAGQSGLANRKITLTDEKARIAAERPALAAEYAEKKAEYDTKLKAVDAKRVEAIAEDKGVEGTGKQGRGPVWRERMGELNLMQNTAKIAEERMKDAQKRLIAVESRLSAIDRELATIDGDLAKFQGEAETAEQRIKLAQDSVEQDAGPKLDPSRILPAFEQAKAEFRAAPTIEGLARIQRQCNDITSAMASTPETKELVSSFDCDPKATADAGGALFALERGTVVFNNTCVGGDKLVAQKSADDLFAFARKCLADSALPSQDTDQLRTKINYIELSRDDKAHRFVVTLNAFQDGNHLAYLALAIAIGLDGLIFLSGLFGANALRSPLSDVPTNKSRSAAQLEATINAALGPHPHETAWLTLNALRPTTNVDGFSAMADLSAMERSAADRVRMVLTAGADIGAVESISVNPERYRVRSELREYLSVVCDKHFRKDATAKDRARLDQLVSAALAPHPREHAEIVLHTLEPIRETEGFTSMVTLSEIESAYDSRVVRRVMNAGSALKTVAPDVKIDDRYYIRPSLYETLLTIRATAPESPNYEYERRRYEGVERRPAIDGGALRDAAPELPLNRARELAPPATALPQFARLSAAEEAALKEEYRNELLSVFGLDSATVDQRFAARGAREAIIGAWKMLDAHAKKNDLLGRVLREYEHSWDRKFSETYSNLLNKTADDDQRRFLVEAAQTTVANDFSCYMLMPELNLIDNLIGEIERAAQSDDGLQPGEQLLKDQLRFVREGLGELNLANPRSWDEIKRRLTPGAGKGSHLDFKRFAPRRDDGDGNSGI